MLPFLAAQLPIKFHDVESTVRYTICGRVKVQEACTSDFTYTVPSALLFSLFFFFFFFFFHFSANSNSYDRMNCLTMDPCLVSGWREHAGKERISIPVDLGFLSSRKVYATTREIKEMPALENGRGESEAKQANDERWSDSSALVLRATGPQPVC